MQNTGLNYTLVGLFIILLSFFTVVFISNKNISSVDAIQGLLKNSNSYSTISQIVQLEIKSRYPVQITSDPIKIAIANYIVNAVVQADSVETLTSYALPAAQKFAAQPTSILNNQVVVDTTNYKQQLAGDLTNLNLPPILVNTTQTVVQGIPDSLTLVDLNQHPNSVLAKIIRARTFIENLGKTVTYSAILLGITILALIFINLRYLTRLLWSLMWGFVGAGILILVAGFLTPYLLNPFTDSATQLDILYNNLGNGLIQYIFSLANKWAIIYFVLAVVGYLILRFAPIDSAQNWLDEKIKPMYVPKAEGKTTKGRKNTKATV